MRRGIRPDAPEAHQIVVAKILGPSPAGSIAASASRRRVAEATVPARKPSFAHSLLTAVQHRLGAWKSTPTRLRYESSDHPAGRRPADVDGQHGLHKVLKERGASEQTAAASRDQRALFSHSAAIAEEGRQSAESQRRARFWSSGRSAGANPSQRDNMTSGPCWTISTIPSRSPIRSRRQSRPSSGSQDHGARWAQPWLPTVSSRSIGQIRGRIASPELTRSATPATAVQAASSACRRSARMSSSCSIPIESRT
jgi:uncharacterized protein involved in type VI secretion and phage assembly